MGVSYFNPHPQHEGARSRGCFTCESFHGKLTGCAAEVIGTHVVCEHRGRTQVIGLPKQVCAC
jgi:hypothetical protein